MVESRNPLASFHRTYSERLAGLSGSEALPLHKFRLTWNAFARLLDLKYEDSFKCDTCGLQPPVVICDGTTIGLNKKLLEPIPDTERESSHHDHPVDNGTKHSDRVFIPNPKIRKLLLQYSSTTHPTEKPFSCEEYKTMIQLMKKNDHLHSLTRFIDLISDQGRNLIAPREFSPFLQDLSKNSPTSAILQLPEQSKAKQYIKEVIHGLDIFSSENQRKLEIIQQDAPVIFDFLSGYGRTAYGVPREVRHLLRDVLLRARNSYAFSNNRTEDNIDYPAPQEDPIACFPCLPKHRGKPVYSLDRTSDRHRRGEDACKKLSNKHPTLSPGIFTMHCMHGVCYGFQAMRQVESPEIPFNILTTRFTKAPEIVIYDNSCRLHQYCLNREPRYFMNTTFLVDRLHWKNHTGF
ncbi:uncharacterized protein [Ptychodera flava]|uniref:uncharacterized protein n=1 Tax=Ptychodera flava TaxID=63121 RepID=UPI00396AA571